MLNSMRQFKAEVFQALAHPTRIAIVEQLRLGEMSVGQLCEKLEIEQANASQHLAILRGKHIVHTRKAGNQIFYSLRDPAFGKVLEALRDYFFAHASEVLDLLRHEQAQARQESSHKDSPRRRAKQGSKS